MQYKTTKRLFRGTYQYKVVLVCAGASYFRSGDMEGTLETLKKVVITPQPKSLQASYSTWRAGIKTQEDLDYAFKLQAVLAKMSGVDVRVESPWISVYTNDKSHIDKLAKLDESKIKYVSVPPPNSALNENTVIMPKVNFEFKVTMGKTNTAHEAFITWAESNAKVKLTKTCKRELARVRSWGGTYFYISGENNLLMAKMHLGGSINKIERILKA